MSTSPEVPMRPSTLAELSEGILHRLWDENNLKPMSDCLAKARRYRTSGFDALERGDKEAAFIYLSRAAILMLEKIPSHPEAAGFRTDQKETLFKHGESLLPEIARLKKEVRAAREAWEEEEKAREEQLAREQALLRERQERNLDRVKRVLDPNADLDDVPGSSSAEAEPSQPPAVPTDPEKSAHADLDSDVKQNDEGVEEHTAGWETAGGQSEKLQALARELSVMSRPASPSNAHEALLSQRNLVPSPEWNSGNDEVFDGENPPPTYEEVMGDVLGLPAASRTPRPGSDAGSDYHIEVVEPDTRSTGARTPSFNPTEYSLVAAEGKKNHGGAANKKDDGVAAQSVDEKSITRGREAGVASRPTSRRSSIAKSRNRSNSPRLAVANPDAELGVDAQREKRLLEVEMALDEVYSRLSRLQESGVTLTPAIRERLQGFKRFLG